MPSPRRGDLAGRDAPAGHNAPLRVLFVCGADFRAPSEKQALGFAERLAADGHSVLISIAGSVATAPETGVTQAPGLRLRRHRQLGRWVHRGDLVAARRFAPHLVHAFNPRLPVLTVARAYARACGVPVFVHFEDDEWGLGHPRDGESAGKRRARRVRRAGGRVHAPLWPFATEAGLDWVARQARGVDALTPALAAQVMSSLGRSCTVILPVTPHFVPLAAPARRAGSGHGEEAVIVYTGALYGSHEADVRLGMRAVAEVQRCGRLARLVHAGAIAPRFDPLRMAEEEGMRPGTAVFLGSLPFPRMPEVLAAASVLIQPGRPTEFNRLRLPSKLQTYLASGVPTVTFAVGFGELLQDRQEVLKTYTGEAAELAERIIEVLDDAELRDRLAAGGPAAAARLFDLRRNTDELVAYYRAGLCLRTRLW